MTNSAKLWIWLTLATGFNNPKHKRIYETYDSITEFYNGGVFEWRLNGIFTQNEINALENTNITRADEIITQCKQLGYDVICIDDERYPEKLKDIYAPPCVIYVWGKLPDFDSKLSIGMVGTRNATRYGVMVADTLSVSLSKLGVIVVSGGALGIDAASHKGTLEVNGTTVCVLGCGIDCRYLTSNAAMRRSIAQTGAVISEYPPGTGAFPSNFPIRNRIISGLSDGVVVVEADEKSGSLITVNHALEQGREVFAVMGNINSKYSKGTNKMIKDGAIPVTSFMDIIEVFPNYRFVPADDIEKEYEYAGQNDSQLNKEPVIHKESLELSDTVEQVYKCIGNELIHIDQIVMKTGLPVSEVLQSLTELEIMSLISCQQGRLYKLA